ncbi:ankyrin repeat-containing domain protein [Aspergillus multicolor]|uniref:ankyrin repeat-containing domain protein n=1 Tax=Aspergillus multicolor TaxID=41759 RepID=UPI003CCCD9A9
MKALTELPNELVLYLAEHLPTSTLNTLSQISKWSSELLTTELYSRATSYHFGDEDHPLIWASRNHKACAFNKLLPYCTDCLTLTAALHTAVDVGNEDAVDTLLDEGADPNIIGLVTTDDSGELVGRRLRLIEASGYGRYTIVKRVLESLPHLKKGVKCRTKPKDHELVTLLLSFNSAVVTGHLQLADFIFNETKLSFPPDVGPILFHKVIEHADVSAMSFLFSRRHEINKRDCLIRLPQNNLPEHGCKLSHTHEFINCVWEQGPILNTTMLAYDNDPRLHQPPYQTHMMAKEVLEWGADVNAVDPDNGQTGLHVAAYMSDYVVAELLLERGANINAVDDDGKSALVHLLEEPEPICAEALRSIVLIFMQKGADANLHVHGENDYTALHLAAQLPEYPGLLYELITKNVDINAKDLMGMTPLHVAAANQHMEAIRTLIYANANTEIKDIFDRKPIDISRSLDHIPAVRVFERVERENEATPPGQVRNGWLLELLTYRMVRNRLGI